MSFKNNLTENNKLTIGILGIMLAIILYLFDSRFLLIPAVFAPVLLSIFKSNRNIGIISILISIGCLIAGIYNTYELLFVFVPNHYMYGYGGSLGLMPVKLAFGIFIILYSLFCSYCLTIGTGKHEGKFCSECGEAIKNETKYCPNCGNKL